MGPAAPNVLWQPPLTVRAEIAVLGSGPGGSITAGLLAEAGRDVVLVEDGPYLSPESCLPFSREEMVQKYRNGGLTVTTGGARIAYVEGRCVGGGSEVNSGLYHRTPPEALDEWARDFQLQAASEAAMRPHFEAGERDLSVSPLPGPAPAASLKLHAGASALGWKSVEVPRWYRYDTAGPEGGVRQSMTRTFVPRFLGAGGKLLPETRALRLARRAGRWSVRAEHGGAGRLTIEADTVFVACGAIQTPALLRRSGIRANVGDTLRMHPTVKVVAEFSPEVVNAPGMGVPVHQLKEFAPRFSFGCSISSPPHLALALLHHPERLRALGDHWRHLAIYYAMTCAGQGRVRTLPFFRDPLVRYQLTPDEGRDLAEALRQLCRCLLAAGAVCVLPSQPGAPAIRCPEDLRLLPERLDPRACDLMTIHLFSSCPMGEDRGRCAVDSFGKVHGAKNLYVADASLLSTAPGVNPQGSVMAFARRNALKFLGRL
jgi:choline dehydrogenase-like flavoprotein